MKLIADAYELIRPAEFVIQKNLYQSFWEQELKKKMSDIERTD